MAQSLKLLRLGSDAEVGTPGLLSLDGIPRWVTVERPWYGNLGLLDTPENKNDISCIPPGVYPVRLYPSPKHGPVYQICNVPKRTYIEIHIANYDDQVVGCVAIGLRFGMVTKKDGTKTFGVLDSAAAFGDFMKAMGGFDGTIQINNLIGK